jgi:hypothetical protein
MRTDIRYLLALAVLAGTGFVSAVVALPAQGASEIKQGAAIAPVTLNMRGLNPALVREGSFIVNAQGGCNDCHTVPSYALGGNPFSGQPEEINAPCYLAGGAEFGPFRSRNLTPRNGLPAGRTLAEFKDLMRNGTDYRNDATPILQVMPWPVYGKMSDKQLEAVYEFLRAIPTIDPRPAFCVPPPGPPA